MRSSVRFAESEEPEEYPLTPTPRDDDANPRHGGDFTKKMRRKTGTILAGHEAEGLTEEGVVWAEKAKVREQQILKNEMEMRETHGKELRQLRAELREEKVVAMEHELLYQTLQGKYDALEQAMESEVAKRIHEETEKLYARKVEMEENEHRLRQEQAELERERQHLEDTIEEQRTTNGAHGESRMRRFVLRMAHGRLQTGWSRLVLVTHALKHAESAESLAEISARHERAVAAAASVERDATAKLSQLARERDVLRSEHSETSAAAAQASAALKTTARARNTAETQVEVLSKEKATLSAELKSIRRELRSAENDRSGAEGDAARGVRENERNRAALAEKTAALDASERALRVKQAAWTKEATSLKASVDGLERRLRRAEAEAKTAELARVSAVRDATGIAAELEHLNARNAAQVDELAAAHAAAQDAQANAHATDRVRAAKGHAALSEQAERLVAAKVKAHNAEKTKLCAAHHKAVAAAERRDADLMAQIAVAKGEAARAERARAAAHQRSLKAAEEEQRRTHTAALSAARLVHATAIDDHASQHARKLAALDTSHRNALKVAAADAAAATTAAVASEKLKHLQVQARRDAEHSSAVEALHRAHTAELERRDEGFAQELETLRIMEEKKRRALAGELSNTVDEAKRVHSAELAGSREMVCPASWQHIIYRYETMSYELYLSILMPN